MPRSGCQVHAYISLEEREALANAAETYGLTLTELIRLFARWVETPGANPMSREPIVFDKEAMRGLVRNLRAIGGLYNQSVAALNTMAKLVRLDEADPEHALRTMQDVHRDMRYVRDQLDCVREDVALLAGRPVIWFV